MFLLYIAGLAVINNEPESSRNELLWSNIIAAWNYFFGYSKFLSSTIPGVLLLGSYVIFSFFQILGLIIFGIKFSTLSKYYRVGWIRYAGLLLVLSGIIGWVNDFHFLLPHKFTELGNIAPFLFTILAAYCFALGIVGINGASRRLLFRAGISNRLPSLTKPVQDTQASSDSQSFTPELTAGIGEERIRVLGTTYIK